MERDLRQNLRFLRCTCASYELPFFTLFARISPCITISFASVRRVAIGTRFPVVATVSSTTSEILRRFFEARPGGFLTVPGPITI